MYPSSIFGGIYSLAAGVVWTINGACSFSATLNKEITCSGFETLIAGIQNLP